MDTSFTVNDYANANIFAISGSQSGDTVKLHALKSAIDEESSGYTSDANADDSLIYINVANIHPRYQSIKVYLLEGDETIDTAPVDAVVEYGGYSDPIKLTSARQRIVAVDSNGETVFESGEKTLQDAFQQILIFAESSSDAKAFRAYYFYGSTTKSEIWGSSSGEAPVRIFNAIWNETLTKVVDTSDGEDLLDGNSLEYSEVSEYTARPVHQNYFETNFDGVNPSPYLTSGMYETVILAGRADDAAMVQIANDQRALATKARVRFIHLGYKADSDNNKPYNIHLMKADSTEEIRNRVPQLKDVTYLGGGQIQKRAKAGDDVGTAYYLRVMDENNLNQITSVPLLLTLKSGSNCQIALIKNDKGGFELINLDDSNGSCQ